MAKGTGVFPDSIPGDAEPRQACVSVRKRNCDLDDPAAANPLQEIDSPFVFGSFKKPVSRFTLQWLTSRGLA